MASELRARSGRTAGGGKTAFFLQFFLWGLLLWVGCARAYDGVNLEHTSVRLSSEYQAIDGRQSFWVLLEFKIKPGWHTYWVNPGDSGMPPKLTWNLPQGVNASKIYWLPPEKIAVGSLLNYGYTGHAYHLVRITPRSSYRQAFLPMELHASWLVCRKECVPEHADLSLSVPFGRHNKPGENFDKINRLVARTQLPTLMATAGLMDKVIELAFDRALTGKAYFFAEQKGIIEPNEPQRLSVKAGSSRLTLARGGLTPKWPMQGILTVDDKSQTQHYRVSAGLDEAIGDVQAAPSLPLLLIFALLGGLILNLMPCVFPVLSLKILALKSSSNKRLQGIMYTFGVVFSFTVIASVLITLQAMGNKVGWGFQMQSPVFIIGLIYLFTLVALNLFGFYEVPFTLKSNMAWRNRHQWMYAFTTGVLACIVATPCSAPFMATAVGIALTRPVIESLLIFMGLGLGLALPYLILCFIPALANLLPKPGLWMETLKQLLAFPMLLSVVWLLWVLGQQIPFDGVALILLSLCFVLLTFWWWRRLSSQKMKYLSLLVSLSLVAYPLAWMMENDLLTHREPMRSGAFNQQKLDALIEKKKKVFVYATAAWCITCKLNEKVALDTEQVRQAFQQYGVSVLKADWTNQDQAIFNYLQGFGRAGVPLYVYYTPGEKPQVLPQVLTPNIIIDAVSK